MATAVVRAGCAVCAGVGQSVLHDVVLVKERLRMVCQALCWRRLLVKSAPILVEVCQAIVGCTVLVRWVGSRSSGSTVLLGVLLALTWVGCIRQ